MRRNCTDPEEQGRPFSPVLMWMGGWTSLVQSVRTKTRPPLGPARLWAPTSRGCILRWAVQPFPCRCMLAAFLCTPPRSHVPVEQSQDRFSPLKNCRPQLPCAFWPQQQASLFLFPTSESFSEFTDRKLGISSVDFKFEYLLFPAAYLTMPGRNRWCRWLRIQNNLGPGVSLIRSSVAIRRWSILLSINRGLQSCLYSSVALGMHMHVYPPSPQAQCWF